MTGEGPDWFLNQTDRQMEENQDGPALSAGLHQEPYWESFNEWRCFDASLVSVSCRGHYFATGMETLLPSIRVEHNDEALDFDFEDDRSINCAETINFWTRLIESQKSVCLYAAYLQEIDENNGYWILSMLKTPKGYWPEMETGKVEDEETDVAE